MEDKQKALKTCKNHVLANTDRGSKKDKAQLYFSSSVLFYNQVVVSLQVISTIFLELMPTSSLWRMKSTRVILKSQFGIETRGRAQ